jgi:hypothetical protein
MKYMYKGVFWFVLIVKKSEISKFEMRTGQQSSQVVLG